MEDEILEFINRRWSKTDADWQTGNCYWFAWILTMRFPNLGIFYLPITGHFVAGDGVNFYDSLGKCIVKEIPFKLTDLMDFDKEYYHRLMRDCFE